MLIPTLIIILGHFKNLSVEKLEQSRRVAVNQANTGTVPNSTLGKLLVVGAERI